MTAPAHVDELLATLRRDWLGWLRIRYSRVTAHHPDLVQQAAADLLQWAAQREQPATADELRRVGFRVLQRRAADLFRGRVHNWALEGDTAAEEELPGASSEEPDAMLERKRLLRAIMTVLTEFSAEERALLVGDELGPQSRNAGARSPAERQRLRRMRTRLRQALVRRFGIDINTREKE